MATGTLKTKDGRTTHRCRTCGKRFDGTGQRGRPFKSCPVCRSRIAETAAERAAKLVETLKAKAVAA